MPQKSCATSPIITNTDTDRYRTTALQAPALWSQALHHRSTGGTRYTMSLEELHSCPTLLNLDHRVWSPTDSPVLIRAISKLASIKRLCMWLWTDFPSLHSCAVTVVSRIYAPAPRFATLALVESVGGAYKRDLTFYLANTPPPPGPRLDVDMGTLYYRQLQKLVTEAGPTPISLRFSCPPEIDGQERLTEVGVFKALRGFVQCAIALTPLADKVAIITEFLSWSVDAGFILALPFHHGDFELDGVGVSMKDHVAILVAWPWLEGPICEIKCRGGYTRRGGHICGMLRY